MIPGTTACPKESTVQHGSAPHPQGKARHRTHGAARRAAELLLSRDELGVLFCASNDDVRTYLLSYTSVLLYDERYFVE